MVKSGVQDTSELADATDLCHVGLDDVEGAPFDERDEALSSGQNLAAGDGDRSVVAKTNEAFDVVGREGFLEPDDVVVGEHARSFDRPFVSVGPEPVAASRVDHDLDIRTYGFAGDSDELFVHRGIDATERSPTQLQGFESPGSCGLKNTWECGRILEQERAVGLNPVSIVATEEAADGLSTHFSENVPQGDVDPADGVCDSATPALPERHLMELFGDAFGFVRTFTDEVGSEQVDCAVDESLRCEAAADALNASVGFDHDERVEIHTGSWLAFPSCHGSLSEEGDGSDVRDFHG